MHPEIEAAITSVEHDYPAINAITLQNAEKLLTYIEDLNLERKGIFLPTPHNSLYILWNVENWEFHMDCMKSGKIFYKFCKNEHEELSGTKPVDEFITQLQNCLLSWMS
jgi:L-rhamnose mutarotase